MSMTMPNSAVTNKMYASQAQAKNVQDDYLDQDRVF